MSAAEHGREGAHRVVVVGGGFGGLQAVRKLRRAPVEVTLIDRRNFHLFQPLVYQVATGALSAGEVASPLRAVFKRARNVNVVLGEVTGFDLSRRQVLLGGLPNGDDERTVPYDSLIVAAGSSYSYFGREDWRPLAPDVKSLESAIEVRSRILTAFEAAELETDPDRRAAWLTFVVVGAGPTGVELAGQIGELARDVLRRDFRKIDTRSARILLVELADRVLPGFPPRLSGRAHRALERLGVTPLVGRMVVEIDAESVTIGGDSGEAERVPARTAVWAAGVVASTLASALAAESGAALDRAGRVAVAPDLTLPGHPEVVALGDMVQVHDEGGQAVPLPGVAPVAMQQGRYAARVVTGRLSGRHPGPFRYRDKGNLATIGRAKAVADIKGLQLSGLLAWLTWLFVHLFYLIGLQNRALVFIRWIVSFATHGRGARLITSPAASSRAVAAAGRTVSVQVTVVGSGVEHEPRAEEVGRLLAERGCTVVTGGLGEVMAAAARGAKSAGGATIGILPGESRSAANPWIDHAVATGIGHARNLAVAASGDAVVAIGGSWGTLAEIAFAKRLGRPVVILEPGQRVAGVPRAATPEEAVDAVLAALSQAPAS